MASPDAMTSHLCLTAHSVRPILAALEALARESESRRVALLHDSGLVLAEYGEDAAQDRGESGALAAGAFFTARQLARRLGEESFSGLHYQGVHRDFLLAAVGPEALLLVVFDQRTKPAIVRACVHKILPILEAATTSLYQATPPPPPEAWVPFQKPFRELSQDEPDFSAVFQS